MNNKSVLWRETVQAAADRKTIGDNCCNRARNGFGVSRFAVRGGACFSLRWTSAYVGLGRRHRLFHLPSLEREWGGPCSSQPRKHCATSGVRRLGGPGLVASVDFYGRAGATSPVAMGFTAGRFQKRRLRAPRAHLRRRR